MTERRTRKPAAVAPIITVVGLAAIVGCGTDTPAGGVPSRPDRVGSSTADARPASAVDPAERPKPDPTAQYHEHQGVRVAFEMLPAQATRGRSPGDFREGDDVRFRFTLSDVSTGAGLTNTHPAAWLATRAPDEPRDALAAAKAIARFVRGDRLFRPALDLNVFYVLTMNDDASVTVVDPLFGFGNTKLLAMVRLQGNATDWALSRDQSRLYISTPSSNRITVVDTTSWSEIAVIEGIPGPNRLELQPDGHYLWVAFADSSLSGVAAVATDAQSVQARIATGRGTHEIAFDGGARHAFVTNGDAGTVSAVEIRTLTKVADLATGPAPRSVAYSTASQMVYVADATDGSIAIISPESLSIVGRANAEPGITQLRFSPDGKFGFAVNPRANAVHILDAVSGRVVQTAGTDKNPDQVVFAGSLAYVRHLDSPIIRIVPLGGLGIEGRPVSVIDFPAGQNSPQARRPEPSLASSIVSAPGEDAVLVANPSDRTTYYYKQGMSAPIGSFSNYGRMPRAVLTLDRSLRERLPGVYETVGRLGAAGDYNLAFLLDTPRIAHYFDVKILPDPERAKQSASGVVVTTLPAPTPTSGERAKVRFQLTDRSTGTPAAGIADVTVLAFSPSGWQRRLPAVAVAGDGPGIYSIEWTPPRPGPYYFYAEAPSVGARLNEQWFLTVEVKDSQP
jgi:DNA-binding beta-propeller fold protein YncE